MAAAPANPEPDPSVGNLPVLWVVRRSLSTAVGTEAMSRSPLLCPPWENLGKVPPVVVSLVTPLVPRLPLGALIIVAPDLSARTVIPLLVRGIVLAPRLMLVTALGPGALVKAPLGLARLALLMEVERAMSRSLRKVLLSPVIPSNSLLTLSRPATRLETVPIVIRTLCLLWLSVGVVRPTRLNRVPINLDIVAKRLGVPPFKTAQAPFVTTAPNSSPPLATPKRSYQKIAQHTPIQT